jgi:type II secretory pathway pseudopilin PulG
LLIIVAVILVIAAIAIPKLLRPQLAANEAAAANSLLVISSAELKYAAGNPTVGFTCTLSPLADRRLIDPALAGGSKAGYVFSLAGCSGAPATSYLATAQPAVPGETGTRVFCSDQTGIIRFSPDSRLPCTTLSRPVE